ncbi:MAG: type II secretion system F family protein [bacterium]
MTTFHYKIIDKNGQPVENTVEAKDKGSLYEIIRKDASAIVSIEESKNSTFSFSKYISFFGGVKMHDKIVFARNLGQMIDAGLPINRGLSIMERQAKSGTFKKVLGSLNESLSKGNTLSDSMKNYPNVFPTLFIAMVRAGEESGNLSMALKNVALQMEKSYQLNKKIKGALMYPAVILTLMIIIGVLMMVYMVPTLTSTFVGLGIKLPWSTRLIITVSDFLKNNFLITIIGVIVATFLISAGFKTQKGGRMVDWTILRIPVIGEIVKEINSARTARTLSSLLSAGVDIVLAINVTKDVIQNSYYKDILEKIQKTIQKGDQISTVFLAYDKFYPLFVGEMVSVGEETGKIGEMLLGVATFYEDEVDQKTKDMSSIVEPVLMIIIGVAVGFFAISMLAPTYSLADSI